MSVSARQAWGAERAAAFTPGREGQRGHVVRGEDGAGGGGAGLPRGAGGGGGAEARRRVDAGGSPPDRQTGTDGRPGAAAAAGRPEACKSDFPAGSPRRIRFFFLSLFFFFFFQILERFRVFFYLFLFFFFRLLSPKAGEAAATRGGERRLGEPPLHLYPPRALLVEGRLATWAQSCPPTRPGGPRRGSHARATRCGCAVPQRPLARGGPLRGAACARPQGLWPLECCCKQLASAGIEFIDDLTHPHAQCL